MASMKGKVIAVTGAASGIGLATVSLLLSRGAKVAAADVQESVHEAVKKVAGSDSASVMSSIVDVRKIESVQSWVEEIVKKFGGLDCVANIAGVYKAYEDRGVEAEDEQNWNFMLDVNLTGVMHCMRAQLPHVRSGGSVVNCASILATRGWGGAAAYSASKHGVVSFSQPYALCRDDFQLLEWNSLTLPIP